MNITELRSMGGILSTTLVPKEVTWAHKDDQGNDVESTFTVHVARISFGAIERLMKTPDDESRAANFIAMAVRLGEDGSETIAYDDAFGLAPALATELIRVVNEVNPPAAEKK